MSKFQNGIELEHRLKLFLLKIILKQIAILTMDLTNQDHYLTAQNSPKQHQSADKLVFP